MVSRCFTWVPIRWLRRSHYIPELGLFYKEVGFYLEELGQGCRIIWQGFY